jgi:NAD(P)-dependent dehydrogenase (short-subunit alcohol dehydrogenase family)
MQSQPPGVMSTRRFVGRVAMVTGGASGIGAAIVRQFVSEGGKVAILDVDQKRGSELAWELGDAVISLNADVTCENDIEHAIAMSVERLGPLHVAFNAAGRGIHSNLVDCSERDWRRVQDLVINGVFFSMKHEAKRMIAQGSGGAIVNIASVTSVQPNFGRSAYAASKAAVVALSRSGALELGDHGIRVNSISPGIIDTPLTQSFIASNPALVHMLTTQMPVHRIGRVEDVSAAAMFLASDDSSYITGTDLLVDGGWMVSGGQLSMPAARNPTRFTNLNNQTP